MRFYFSPVKIKCPSITTNGEHYTIDMKGWFCWFCITKDYDLEWSYRTPSGETLELVNI